MDASSTTENIQGKIDHNHKPNFGRYVKGCSACIAKYPNGPVKRERKPKEDPSAQKIAELNATIAKLLAERPAPPVPSNSTDELVKIMLRRESEAILKEEEKAARIKASREDMLRVGREQEAMKRHREDSCSHLKENGRSAIAQQQVHNDGMVHPFCQRCFKTFTPSRPSQEQMPTSVGA